MASSRWAFAVGLCVLALLAASGPAYALAGAASSGRGPAASAQYPNSGVGQQAEVNPSVAQGVPVSSAAGQQSAASGSGSLPFTGFTIALIALLGVAVLGAGVGLRARARHEQLEPPLS